MTACVTGQPNLLFNEVNRSMAEIYVKVRTDQETFRIEHSDFPIIHLESEAVNGKANAELVSRLEKILGQKPAIISGHRSRRKKIKADLPKEQITQKLGEYNV